MCYKTCLAGGFFLPYCFPKKIKAAAPPGAVSGQPGKRPKEVFVLSMYPGKSSRGIFTLSGYPGKCSKEVFTLSWLLCNRSGEVLAIAWSPCDGAHIEFSWVVGCKMSTGIFFRFLNI
jgi:hypothetical protein